MKHTIPDDIKIIKYSKKYTKDLEECAEGLQKYLASVDTFDLLYCPKNYGRKYVSQVLLKSVQGSKGVVFLAQSDSKIVGFVTGIFDKLPAEETLGYKKKLKAARVVDLYVDENCRGIGVGKLLLQTVERYFIAKKCDQIKIEVYAPNKDAYKFYQGSGYQTDSIDLVKKLK